MKIRGSVVSLSSIFPHSPEDIKHEEKKPTHRPYELAFPHTTRNAPGPKRGVCAAAQQRDEESITVAASARLGLLDRNISNTKMAIFKNTKRSPSRWIKRRAVSFFFCMAIDTYYVGGGARVNSSNSLSVQK